MNGLSWLIYIAGVVSNVSLIFFIEIVILAIFSIISTIFILVSEGDEDVIAFWKKYVIKLSVPILIITSLIFSFIPSKQTIYMIAASEMGEKIYQQPGTQEVMGTLKDTVINELKKLQKN